MAARVPSTLARLVLTVALVVVAGYAIVVFLAWRLQERIVYQPPRVSLAAAPAAGETEGAGHGLRVRRVSYAADDGVRLFAFVVGDPVASARTVVAFHGNADLARWMIPWGVELAHRTGAAVILPEYRGYGGLGSAPNYAGVSRDAEAALAMARDSFALTPDHLVLYGHSLGSAVATEAATAMRPRVLVLESPFTSARAMASRMGVPGLGALFGAIARVHYTTVDRVRALDVPVWVVHGTRDMVIPVRMGREVFAAAARKGELLIVERAGHNDVADVAGEEYWEWFRRALG